MEERLIVPSPHELPSVQALCDLRQPYQQNLQTQECFINAMKESLIWHEKRSTFFKDLLSQENFSSLDLRNEESLKHLPYVHAYFFKRHEILSMPKEDVYLHLTSSGTTGQKSQIYFDEWSIKSAQRMVDDIFTHYDWQTDKKANYLLFTYGPSDGSRLGTAYTDNFLCKYAPVGKVKYALEYVGDGEHRFDLFGCVRALQDFEEEGIPVRIFGFPSFFYFVLDFLKKRNMRPFKLHPESLVFLGGGWKGHQNEAIAKNEFYALVTEYLGIPDVRLRDGFGSVEHCIPYIECANHNFHVPVWSRVLIRSVQDLELVEFGQPGYLQFISPYITSVPAISVLMGDLARLWPGSHCQCGLSTPYFEILGRAGTSKNRSCAVAASELLKNY